MLNKKITLYILLAGYLLVIIAFTRNQGIIFSDFGFKKGDEIINYAFFLLLASILCEVLFCIITKSIDWKAVILATIINFMLSFILAFAISVASGLGGVSQDLVFTYAGCYLMLFTIVTVLQINRLRNI